MRSPITRCQHGREQLRRRSYRCRLDDNRADCRHHDVVGGRQGIDWNRVAMAAPFARIRVCDGLLRRRSLELTAPLSFLGLAPPGGGVDRGPPPLKLLPGPERRAAYSSVAIPPCLGHFAQLHLHRPRERRPDLEPVGYDEVRTFDGIEGESVPALVVIGQGAGQFPSQPAVETPLGRLPGNEPRPEVIPPSSSGKGLPKALDGQSVVRERRDSALLSILGGTDFRSDLAGRGHLSTGSSSSF